LHRNSSAVTLKCETVSFALSDIVYVPIGSSNANKGAMLSHVDPTSISMVVKDQLPLLAANCESGALLPDKLFKSTKNIETMKEPSIR